MKPVFLFAAIVAGGICNATSAFAAADPTDAQAAVAPLKYQSPFRDYRVLGEDKRVPWKDANDEVARIGGWRAMPRKHSKLRRPTPRPEHCQPPSRPPRRQQKLLRRPQKNPHRATPAMATSRGKRQ